MSEPVVVQKALASAAADVQGIGPALSAANLAAAGATTELVARVRNAAAPLARSEG